MDMSGPYAATKQYLIRRAQHLFGFHPDRVEALRVGGVKELTTLGVIGQPLGLTWLLRAIMGQQRRQLDPDDNKPLVMVFGGKPGHGKTQTAELLARLKLGRPDPNVTPSDHSIKIHCNTSRHMGDFLGHATT